MVGCAICGKPATCFGAYENAAVEEPACDDCCGHACEDDSCVPIEDATLPAHAAETWPVAPREG